MFINILPKKLTYIPPKFQNKTSNHEKQNHFFNDSEAKRISLSCNEKITCIINTMTSNHDGDFYCLNWLYSFRFPKGFCGVIIPSKDTRILELSQH